MLVSATMADGPPRRVLRLVGLRRAELVMPVAVIDELFRVLTEKIGVDIDSIARLRALLDELNPSLVATPQRVEAVSGDPDDDRILAAAFEGRADLFVTGDRRHLLPLGSYRGMRILSPQSMLAEMLR